MPLGLLFGFLLQRRLGFRTDASMNLTQVLRQRFKLFQALFAGFLEI
jgi:hypothetical protein